MSAGDHERDPRAAAGESPEIATLLAAIALQAEFIEVTSQAHAAFLRSASHLLRGGAFADPPRRDAAGAAPTAGPIERGRQAARMGRFSVRPAPAIAAGWTVPGLLRPGARVIIVPDGRGVAEALAHRLAERGVRAVLARADSAECDVLLHLGGLREVTGEEDASELCFEAFRSARAIGPQLAARGGSAVFVQDTGGDFGLSGSPRAWSAGIGALAKTASWEWPRAHVRAIDLETGSRGADALAAQLLDELLGGGIELEVGLRSDGSRTTPATVAAPIPPAPAVLGPEDVVLVTGGARGVAAACVLALASESRSRFVLLGRTARIEEPAACAGVTDRAQLTARLYQEARARGEAPGPRQLDERVRTLLALRDVDATLREVDRLGGRARYVSVDVLDEAALARALEAVRSQWGPITALVHAAGINRDRRIVDKGEGEARAVFDTKVRGLRNALRVTANDPLRVLCAFSSTSGRWGNPGQADYAMANEVVAKVLSFERRRRPSLTVCRALDWGPWDGGMVTAALRARWETAGVPVIPLDHGAAMFRRELSAGSDDTEVVLGAEFGTLVDGAAPSTAAELLLSPATYPQLESHAIVGRPVVPVALVHEWMVRMAHGLALAPEHVRLTDLRVLRGVPLERWPAADLLALRAEPQLQPGECARPVDVRALAFTLHDRAGALRYRGQAHCSQRPRAPRPAAPPGRLQAWEGPIYGPGRLFHGPMFQVLSGAACGADAARAGLVGGGDVGWTGAAWRTDPALVDGALQLVGLWAQHAHGGAWLPTSVGEIEVYRPGLLRGTFAATLQGRRSDGDHAVADVWVQDASGEVVAELLAVTFHRYAP